ncbi:MAG: hypothetical protein GEU90_20715 [Gemmatimonas sp.]|nr:hypothetical protein [Gemmatimonas sp.]
MRRDELGGWCMIAGAVLGLITMGFHPHSAAAGTRNAVVHSIALFAVPVALYGGWALSRRLSTTGPIGELALVFYGLAAVATVMASTAAGLVAPDLLGSTTGLGSDYQSRRQPTALQLRRQPGLR